MPAAVLLKAPDTFERGHPVHDQPRTAARTIAFIGNSLPRLCGIATFTNDLERSVASARKGLHTSIVAMSEPGQVYAFPDPVCLSIREDRIGDYHRAAEVLNSRHYDAISLQHEFGIFGGEAGGDVMALLTPLAAPLVTTLHTVLAQPTAAQHDVLCRIIDVSEKVVVMARKGRELLETVYRAPSAKIEVIPHGVPDFPFVEPDAAKAKHGMSGKTVILTFGLLAPSKGIDVMIDAMPEVLRRCPDAVYLVLGATHPNLVRQHGESYRESLVARAGALGLHDKVIFLDQFVDQATLLEFISLCDVYVTPYRNEAQLTSGTLAYSVGLGKAVVSTPYWHAAELLAGGRGVLVPFDDAGGFGREVSALLVDEPRRRAMRRLNYTSSRCATWGRTALRYLEVIDGAVAKRGRPVLVAIPSPPSPSHGARWEGPLPDLRTGHLMSMCDDTGLLQHAVHSVPDRRHGYCVDDNARALLLACRLGDAGETPLPDALTSRFASFVEHAWNPQTQRFRNFMSFDRRWLEEVGSEDSHGRTLWALGECARSSLSPTRRRWARGLFTAALPAVESFGSPRAWAFTLLGLDAYLKVDPTDWRADRLRRLLADWLITLLARSESPEWTWFEDSLAYDNARLSQALMLTGVAISAPPYVLAGLRSLRWLATMQTTRRGLFRPVGTDSFQDHRAPPKAFDQQPLEAAASIAAYLVAADVSANDDVWPALAERAFAWFLGANELSVALVESETGGCRDGLHPDRPNENQGAESVLSYLLGLVDMRQRARMEIGGANRSPFPAMSV